MPDPMTMTSNSLVEPLTVILTVLRSFPELPY
jgi:hypothetical protein